MGPNHPGKTVSPSESVPGSLLFNAAAFFQNGSLLLIHCEIQEDPTGREANVLVLGFQQCNHELVYWEGTEQRGTCEFPAPEGLHPSWSWFYK